MVKKSIAQTLKNKSEKLKDELERLQEKRAELLQREKDLKKSIKEVNADYIVALMSESGKTIEDLEEFAQKQPESSQAQTENGGAAHVQNY